MRCQQCGGNAITSPKTGKVVHEHPEDWISKAAGGPHQVRLPDTTPTPERPADVH